MKDPFEEFVDKVKNEIGINIDNTTILLMRSSWCAGVNQGLKEAIIIREEKMREINQGYLCLPTNT